MVETGLFMNLFRKVITPRFRYHIITSMVYHFLLISYSLTCGDRKGDEFECKSNCTSVWFKYVDEESNTDIRDNCGSHFHNKYRNVVYVH